MVIAPIVVTVAKIVAGAVVSEAVREILKG